MSIRCKVVKGGPVKDVDGKRVFLGSEALFSKDIVNICLPRGILRPMQLEEEKPKIKRRAKKVGFERFGDEENT